MWMTFIAGLPSTIWRMARLVYTVYLCQYEYMKQKVTTTTNSKAVTVMSVFVAAPLYFPTLKELKLKSLI